MRVLWPLLLLPLSCMQMPGSAADDAGAAGTDGADREEPPQVIGSDCVTDTKARVTLCTSISSCDDLAVDHDAYPNCGFRVGGSNIDLECLCGDYLCPMGTALSCGQARELLAESNETLVCAQQNEGRCAARTTTEPAEPTQQGGCDRQCARDCVNSPACLELCGC